MPDKRSARTVATIKDALLRLLGRESLTHISVSQLAQEARVSRSTFYCHFQNVNDVFELLIRDFLNETRPLETQLRCSACRRGHDDGKTPYCVAVRSSERFHGVVRDPQYLSSLLRILQDGMEHEGIATPYMRLGLPHDQALSLAVFQMSGCHTVALENCSDEEWPQKQALLDTFIAGGMNAVKAAKSAGSQRPSSA